MPVLMQVKNKVEFIIVNASSTDNTAEIVRGLMSSSSIGLSMRYGMKNIMITKRANYCT